MHSPPRQASRIADTKSGYPEVLLAQTAVESDPAVPSDQVYAAWPRVVGLLGGAVHAIHHGGKRQVEFAQA